MGGIRRDCIHLLGSLDLDVSTFDCLSLLREINVFTRSEVYVAVSYFTTLPGI